MGMRSRIIKEGFFKNEQLGSLPMAARLLFEGLWCLADRDGRLEDRPAKIRAEVFPYDSDVDVNNLLDQLQGIKNNESGTIPPLDSPNRFIVRYQVEGRNYIQVLTFSKHQPIHPKEKSNEFPGIPGNYMESRENPGNSHEFSITSTSTSIITSTSKTLPESEKPDCGASGSAKPKSQPVTAQQVEAIYQRYPRKEGKKKALERIEKALRNGISFQELFDSVEEYATGQYVRTAPIEYIPYPERWFGEERWKDDRSLWHQPYKARGQPPPNGLAQKMATVEAAKDGYKRGAQHG